MSAIATLLLAASCGATAQEAKPAPAAPNLVLIVVDTLRADRLGCYGCARRTSPAVDSLAARGLRFERAYGTAPWTLPSTSSLLTGLQPDVHRATTFFSTISPDARTIAQELAARGYETAAIVGNYFVQPVFGFDRGFQSYDVSGTVDRGGVNSDKVSDAAIAWLAKPHDRPFLLYLHYFDPHYNYVEHKDFTFGPKDTDRVFDGEDVYPLRDHVKQFDAADRERLDALYDSEVAFTDHHVGRVLAKLDERKLTDHTVVVLTADHGESLADHGWIGHTIQLYEESVRVPLIVAGPGFAPEVRGGDPVQLDDVKETLLAKLEGRDGDWSSAASRVEHGLAHDEALLVVETVGIDEPEEKLEPKRMVEQGVWRLVVDVDDLGNEDYKLLKMDEPPGRRRKQPQQFHNEMKALLDLRSAELESRRRGRDHSKDALTRKRALVKGDWKVIVDGGSGEVELYDLRSDPKEQHDLSAEQPERVTALRKRLREVSDALAAAALKEGPPISPEQAEEHRRRIQATGYGSGGK